AEHFTRYLDDQKLDLARRPEAHGLIGAELPNIEAAWQWALAVCDCALLGRLLDGLATWHERAGLQAGWCSTLEQVSARLEVASDDPSISALRARLLVTEGEALLWRGELDRALGCVHAARRLLDTQGFPFLEARLLLCEGRLMRFRGGDDD